MSALNVIGLGLNRVEGRAKVTGRANYAADNHRPGLAHAFGVFSDRAPARVTEIDARLAEEQPGVLGVWHHGNFPPLYRSPNEFPSATKVGEVRVPFEDDRAHYAGQFVAVVVAETFEQARAAARLVRVRYADEGTPVVTIDAGLAAQGGRAVESDRQRGDPAAAWETSPVQLDATYHTGPEVHHPLETHASVATWTGDHLELHESTQWIIGQRNALAKILGIPSERVTVKAPYIGGGFGGKLFLWPHSVVASAISRFLGRPVKLVVERKNQATTVGHRPATRQRLRLGATAEGKLLSIRHENQSLTSMVENFTERCGEVTRSLYACENLGISHRAIPAHIGSPTAMRAPGAAPGLYALECAMDELAVALRLDPLELRLRNLPEVDPESKKPWSSNHFRECFAVAAERFGWARRNAEPGSMREGEELVGWGIAAATWGAPRGACSARVELRADGSARVSCATQDIGTGTYTVVAQVAAEVTSLPIERIEVSLGDSDLPPGPISGGSMVTSTVVPAVAEAARAALNALFRAATRAGGPLAGQDAKKLAARDGSVHAPEGGPATFAAVLAAGRLAAVDGEARTAPGTERSTYSFRCFGVHCAEVRWNPSLARLRVSRVTSVLDAGRIINAKTARNQITGAIMMGVGMALFEESIYDPRTSRVVNDNFADYHIPVHADAPQMDVVFLDHPDPHIGEFGARGIGELGITGLPAAVANAVYHATGKRLRDLPISVEKVLG
jgi:xanthine dehydrogenase YagR molybdenum-binding subunit